MGRNERKTVVEASYKSFCFSKRNMFFMNLRCRFKISKFFLVLTFLNISHGCHHSSEHGLLGLGTYILNGGFGRHILIPCLDGLKQELSSSLEKIHLLSNFVRTEGNKTVTICEGEVGNITCPSRTTIVVMDAIYGRKDLKTCPSEIIEGASCEAHLDSKETIQTLCDGKMQCTLQPTNLLFGDPCPKSDNKYAYIEYRCKHYLEDRANIIEQELMLLDQFILEVTMAFRKRAKSLTDLVDSHCPRSYRDQCDELKHCIVRLDK